MSKRMFLAALLALGVAAALVAGTAGARSTVSLKGAGSSFVAPLVGLWSQNYKAAEVSYSPIGSGGGVNAITAKQVDFGASDAPLTHDQFGACPCVQIPWALSATSVAYNIPGASPGLRITGPIIADIYLGKIDFWDNAKIKKINQGKTIPHVKITPVFRSDASGTTYNFTDYLSKVSKEFKNKIGNGTQVDFGHTGIGARGSSGVANTVKQTPGGVTYVDVAYSLKNHIKFFRVQNAAKKFVTPGIRAIQSAASLVTKVPANNEMHIVDPPAKGKYVNAYPICTFTYVILQKSTGANAEAVKSFVKWALTKGQTVEGAQKLLFVPIPKLVQTKALKTLTQVH
ncbi:MAG: phosphate ABC transporter substrate-binding protein PstS [Actinobacteria bacterium]|nr:phosphate ABC transporter substrate-binding protein PstS [Actinomycetota bacterium]